MTLPPISELQALLHYNQLTGQFTYLKQRGPRKIGDPAGSTQGNIPYLFLNGRQPAALVAWIMANGTDPSPQHVICIDGNPLNLALCNLALSDKPPCYDSPHRKRGRRPGWERTDIRRHRKTGFWVAKYKGTVIGEFLSRPEAIAARRLAAKEDAEDA
jgi:hypothetical protein